MAAGPYRTGPLWRIVGVHWGAPFIIQIYFKSFTSWTVESETPPAELAMPLILTPPEWPLAPAPVEDDEPEPPEPPAPEPLHLEETGAVGPKLNRNVWRRNTEIPEEPFWEFVDNWDVEEKGDFPVITEQEITPDMRSAYAVFSAPVYKDVVSETQGSEPDGLWRLSILWDTEDPASIAQLDNIAFSRGFPPSPGAWATSGEAFAAADEWNETSISAGGGGGIGGEGTWVASQDVEWFESSTSVDQSALSYITPGPFRTSLTEDDNNFLIFTLKIGGKTVGRSAYVWDLEVSTWRGTAFPHDDENKPTPSDAEIDERQIDFDSLRCSQLESQNVIPDFTVTVKINRATGEMAGLQIDPEIPPD